MPDGVFMGPQLSPRVRGRGSARPSGGRGIHGVGIQLLHACLSIDARILLHEFFKQRRESMDLYGDHRADLMRF